MLFIGHWSRLQTLALLQRDPVAIVARYKFCVTQAECSPRMRDFRFYHKKIEHKDFQISGYSIFRAKQSETAKKHLAKLRAF
jgi:hypothetical protein